MYIVIHEDKEIWTDLVFRNIKPMYEISTYGNIRNKNTGKKLSICKNEKGYAMVSLMTTSTNKKNKTFKVHILVAYTFIPCITIGSEYMTVNHKDGNKDDNSIYNLEWVTFQENIKHSFDHGLNTPRRGELNGRCKYSNELTYFVHKLVSEGHGTKYIKPLVKEKFGIDINRSFVHDIKRNRRKLYN